MAAEPHGTHEFDLTPHIKTWNFFCRLLQVVIPVIVAVLLLMAYFLT